MFDDASKKFALSEILPVAAHYDQTTEFPWPLVKKAQYAAHVTCAVCSLPAALSAS